MIKKLSIFLCLPLLAAQKDDFPTDMVVNPLLAQPAWAEPAQAVSLQELLSGNSTLTEKGKELLKSTGLYEAFPGHPTSSDLVEALAPVIGKLNASETRIKAYCPYDKDLIWILAAQTMLHSEGNLTALKTLESRSNLKGNSSGVDAVLLGLIARHYLLGNNENATQLHYLLNGLRNGFGSLLYPKDVATEEVRAVTLPHHAWARRYPHQEFPVCNLQPELVERMLHGIYGKDMNTICKLFSFTTVETQHGTHSTLAKKEKEVISFFNGIKKLPLPAALVGVFGHQEFMLGDREGKDSIPYNYYVLVLAAYQKSGKGMQYAASLIAPGGFFNIKPIKQACHILEKVTGIKPE